jgi:hypothetical protein
MLGGTYQHQPVYTRVSLSVLGNVPTWHPRTHYAKRKQGLRNIHDRKQVRVGNIHVPVGSMMKSLGGSVLSTSLIRGKSCVHFRRSSDGSDYVRELPLCTPALYDSFPSKYP